METINDIMLECPKCGKMVKCHCYCGEFNGTICDGDPWNVARDHEEYIIQLEKKRDKYLRQLELANNEIQRVTKLLPKNHEKAKLFKNS